MGKPSSSLSAEEQIEASASTLEEVLQRLLDQFLAKAFVPHAEGATVKEKVIVEESQPSLLLESALSALRDLATIHRLLPSRIEVRCVPASYGWQLQSSVWAELTSAARVPLRLKTTHVSLSQSSNGQWQGSFRLQA